MSTHFIPGVGHTTIAQGDPVPAGAVARPNHDPNSQEIINTPSGYEVRDLPVDRRLEAAWELANETALAGADHNSRSQYLFWLIDQSSSQARKGRINAVQAWMSQIWGAYASYRAQLLAGQDPGEFTLNVPPVPWTFWDVAEV